MRVTSIPSSDRAARERKVRMHDDLQRHEDLLSAQAITRRASAGRVVEGKQLRLESRHAIAADRAGVTAREHHLFMRRVVEEREAYQPTRKSQPGLQGFRGGLC